MKERRPTIIDVAREANVSRSLVSLVLQHPEKVSDARRIRVEQAMQRLGYRPNAAARTLARQQTDTIGVIVSDLHNPFYTEVIDGIEESSREYGNRVLIASGESDPAREKSAADTFIELRVEGIVLITPHLDDTQIAAIAATVPTVIIGRPGELPAGCSRVLADDAIGIGLAMDHLFELGHRRIGLVSAGDSPGARARETAYIDYLRDAGLSDNVAIAREAPNQDGGYQAASILLAVEDPPTAILTSNDFAALGALGAIGDRGLSCPDDVSLVGYDNTVFAQLRPISLTTVNQPKRVMGSTAAALLRDLILEGRTSAVALDPELVVRSTTGPLQKATSVSA